MTLSGTIYLIGGATMPIAPVEVDAGEAALVEMFSKGGFYQRTGVLVHTEGCPSTWYPPSMIEKIEWVIK